jgi:uncharacterized phage-associated protein
LRVGDFVRLSVVIKFAFNTKKSAQAGWLLLGLNDGDLDQYCFIKLLYFADREACQLRGEPITGDEAVSMEFGPVLSTIYDLTKGERASLRPDWAPFISDAEPQTHRVFAKEDPGTDELSSSEVKILTDVFARYGHLSFKEMKDLSHSLPEYDGTVGNSSRLIKPEVLLEAVGKSPEEIRETEQSVREDRMLELIFSSR